MYSYEWDKKTRGYKLTTQTGKYVANELRPVFAEELLILEGDQFFDFSHDEEKPLMWAKQNSYFYNGMECAKVQRNDLGVFQIIPTSNAYKKQLRPVDLDAMILKNKNIMESLISDTKKRIKEMYDQFVDRSDIAYIGFSGGKDSMVLLDLCHQILPLTIPVIFSDTDMELPDTYKTWELVQARYSGRPFKKVKTIRSAKESWELFGPPSQALRWCCSVHKSSPPILYLRNIVKKTSAKTLAFVGVRSDEGFKRSQYDDIGDGLKNPNQINVMPLLSWGTHELFLYIFEQRLITNRAYRLGLPRVGCLLCPMSTERQVDLIHKIYPKETAVFTTLIKDTISRDFSSDKDFTNFIFNGGWHARQSGVTLKDVIAQPSEKKEAGSVTYKFSPVQTNSILEWLKSIGTLKKLENDFHYSLSTLNTSVDLLLPTKDNVSDTLICMFSSTPLKSIIKNIKSVLHKSLACVDCRACESECPTGALTFSKGPKIDSDTCIHCLKCHSTQDGCMRYFSKRYAGGTTMNISGINKYMTFGLKQDWIFILADEGDQFRSTSALGKRMVPSAITWFREAKLITNSTAIQPTKLLTLGQLIGFDSEMFWSLIWVALVNYSPLFKWFICNTLPDQKIKINELHSILEQQVNSESVRKGALQSLTGTLKNSPLGTGPSPIVELDQKGVRVVGLTRIPKKVDPLVILYALYLMAEVADRTAFTLSEMMTADFESPYISPLIAFGMSVDELKGQCMGISSIYPQFLSCNFALGLDEVKVFPKEKTLDDVIDLILGT